ncbi:MAG: MATE family efflux transporter [Ignavibacteria bacterium GWA2_35_9]|nr:MAG: MATE family efflux transporter [Ignavibacteria bacterium GWA2_35_9]OGU47797.1 MAG: MATE family efflux transporter [Ignavibacteria bacterium GWB2_36_8]OGU49399.1 MAG: MATE family efflux transporter [Ignavibacteria bacterium GWC2_36_12]
MLQSFKKHIWETFNLAYPVIIGQLGFIMMGVVDSIMVGELGAVPLAGASLGNSMFILIFIIGLGVSMSVTPLIAILVGAKRFQECGIYFRQSLIVNIVLGLILMSVVFFTSNLFEYLNQPLAVAEQASSYTKIIALSIMPAMLFHTYKQFIEGFSIMKPAMIIAIVANIINAFANWVFIYGNIGMPALGLNGAGWATFFSRVFMAFVIMLYVMNKEYFKQFDVNFHFKKINFPVIKKILSIGLPSGFQYFFEVGAFSFAVIMIGWLGTNQLAAHQIAINLASITFMVVLGISAAGGIRVGNKVGKKDVVEVRKAGFTAVIMGASIMFTFGVIFIVLNEFLPTLYIDNEDVIRIASSLIVIAALFQISDGIQGVGIGVLRGLTDVKIPTLITFIAYWVLALPIGYLFGFVFHFGVEGVWVGLLLGLTASAAMLTIRFNIKSKQLVEF